MTDEPTAAPVPDDEVRTPDEAPTIALRGRAVDVEIRAGLSGDETTQVGLLFDCNVLADMEERFSDGYRGFVRYEADEEDDAGTVIHKMGEKVLDENGDPKRQLEYGMEAWQASMNDRPFYTIRMTMALLVGISDREAGAKLIEERLSDYFTAIGAAFAIANGVDPTTAVDAAIEGMRKIQGELRKQAELAVAARDAREAETTPDTPGPSGLPPGQEPADLSTSSGG